MEFVDKEKKKHARPRAGAKLKKHANTGKQENKKGFAIQKTVKAARMVQRTLDHQTKKFRLPNAQRVVEVPPPLVVAIVGPPRCGKSTLLRSLLKHFARQTINIVTGPITVVAGKNLRFTFLECGCDINQMIDISKIADIVLLLVNTRLGLEHYHFEFINLMQSHGMPRVVPILNHLDTYKDSAASRDRRRKLKQRLWTDLNSKIFLITKFIPKYGANKDGDYLLNEIRRLARLITVKVPRLTDWRIEHPYLLIDRVEDLTNPVEVQLDAKCDRKVSFYGWIRGASLPPALTSPGIHIVGLGDFVLDDTVAQCDPCPLPKQLQDAQQLALKNEKQPEIVGKIKRKKYLSERERKVYAPMSSLSGVLLDKDATYIDIGGSHHLRQQEPSKLKASSNLKLPGATQLALNAAQDALQSAEMDIDDQLDRDIQLFSDQKASNDQHETETEDDEDDEEDELDSLEDEEDEQEQMELGSYESSDDEERVENFHKDKAKPKDSLHLHMKKAFEGLDDAFAASSSQSKINWGRHIYEMAPLHKREEQEEEEDDDLLFKPKQTSDLLILGDYTLVRDLRKDWREASVRQLIADCFTSGQWDEKESAEDLLSADKKAREAIENALKEETRLANLKALSSKKGLPVQFEETINDAMDMDEDFDCDADDSDEDADDDFNLDDDESFNEEEEDIADEAGESEHEISGEEETENADPNAEFEKRLLRPTKRQKLEAKKQRHRELFENLLDKAQGGSKMEGGQPATLEFDRMMNRHQAQLARNKEILESLPEESRLALEGHAPGAYVRLQITGVPHEFIDHFDPRQPLVIGGLAKCEESIGFLHARFLTHRWSKRILKSNDPLTLSVGWRRYQTVAVFSKEEHNLRKRFLKYSLRHEHCHMTFYGPLCAPKTGLIAFVNSAWRPDTDEAQGYRVAGTGVILDRNESFTVQKKLKLVGEPRQIFAKTAFITGMFNSSLEVSKVIGAKVQTASKVRGLIKAALGNTGKGANAGAKPGDFRATFEAPIRKADLVFLRSFVQVDLPRYYNPVLNLLCPRGVYVGAGQAGEGAWRMMRTMAELRQQEGASKPENNVDSHYRAIARKPFITTPLEIPVKLAAQLPYAAKPKMTVGQYRRAVRAKQEADPLATNADIPAEVVPLVVAEDENDEQAGSKLVPALRVQQQMSRQELLTKLRDIHADYKQGKRISKQKRVGQFVARKNEEEEKLQQQRKQKRKQFFAQGGEKKLIKTAKRRKQQR